MSKESISISNKTKNNDIIIIDLVEDDKEKFNGKILII